MTQRYLSFWTYFLFASLSSISIRIKSGKKDKLKELGYEDAKSVKLGMIGIAGADPELIVDSSGAVTKEVHNVEPIKGMFPEGFHENL